jgi:hypothetical protein
MSIPRLFGLVLLVLTMLLPGAAVSTAQMFVTTGRDTLRSLPGVEVVVEPVPRELEQAGVTAAGLKADAERRLRAGGVTTYASQEANPSPAKPYLYLHLNALEIPGHGLWVVAVQVHVRQTVRALATSSNIVDAMTWDSHTVVGLPVKDLKELGAEIGEHVDKFIRDWNSVH